MALSGLLLMRGQERQRFQQGSVGGAVHIDELLEGILADYEKYFGGYDFLGRDPRQALDRKEASF